MKTMTGLRDWAESPRRGKNGVQTLRYKQSSDIWSRIIALPVGWGQVGLKSLATYVPCSVNAQNKII